MEKRIKRRIGALVVLGMFMAMMLTPSVAADTQALTDGGNADGEEISMGTTGADDYDVFLIRYGVEHMRLADGITVFNENSGDIDFRIEGNDDGNLFFVDAGNDKVGIGTTGPDAKLDILDDSGAQLRLSHTDGNTFCDFQVDSSHDLFIKPSSNGQIRLQPTTDSTDFFQVLDNDGVTPILNVDSVNDRVGIGTDSPRAKLEVAGNLIVDSYTLYVDSTNNRVGIGISDPAEALEINGNVLFQWAADRSISIETPNNNANGDDLTVRAGHAYEFGGMAPYNGGNLYLRGGDGAGPLSASGGSVYAYGGLLSDTGSDGNVILAHTGSATRGKVGIGTIGPGKALEINSATGDNLRLTYNDDNGGASNYADFTLASDGALTIQTAGSDEDIEIRTGSFDNAIFIDDSGGNVGIGTASPQGALNIDNTGESKGLGVMFDTYHVQTTDDTATTIATISTTTDKVYGLTVTTIGIKSDGSEAAHYVRHLAYRNDGGTLSAVGDVEFAHTAEDDTNWDVTFTTSGTNILVQVTGAAGTTIEWQSTVEKNIVGV